MKNNTQINISNEQGSNTIDDRLEECMVNIKRQAEIISEQARENIILRFKVDELTNKVAQLSGVF